MRNFTPKKVNMKYFLISKIFSLRCICCSGNASVKLFKSDPALFSSYHQGYQHQAAQWPLDPLNSLMTDILRQDSNLVIADLGCGEASTASTAS